MNSLVVGNWKLNGGRDFNRSFVDELLKKPCESVSSQSVQLAICPPAVYLAQFSDAFKQQNSKNPIKLGAQDVSNQEQGAFTGEISAGMLTDFNCQYAIIGHSERRQYHFESSDTIIAKLKLALNHDITPIICVGEDLTTREQQQQFEFVLLQLDKVLQLEESLLKRTVIAYEPVWAIGTGKTATPNEAQEIHHFIRSRLNDFHPEIAQDIAILYGGSVNPKNAQSLAEQPDINGFLVGGASLNIDDFLSISEVF